MNKKQALQNANEITVINDGQFRYPVLTAAMREWITANGPITTANYDAFCADVACLCEAEVGTPGNAGMIEFCAALVEAGADSERLA